MADKAQVRQLKIKTGVLKRNIKDHNSYKTEEGKLQEKLAAWITEGKDEYDIKKLQEQVTETAETLATCKPRIEAAIDDLENVLATFEELPDGEPKTLLKEAPEWSQAEAAIAEAKAFVDAIEL